MGKILLLVAIPLVFLLGACGGSVGQQQGGSAQDAPGPGTATQQTVSPGTTTGDVVATTTAPQAGSVAGMIEPSALLSQGDAEDILGKTVDTVETREQEKVGLKLVLYHAGTDLLQVAITQQAAMPPEQKQTPEDLYRAIVDNFSDAVAVEGIGDEAYFATPGLHILVDDHYLLVAVGNLSDPDNQQRLKQAGSLAVENLRALAK